MKKNVLKPGPQTPWGIPPQATAALVCALEDVREVSTRPYDPRPPQVGVDETSKQLVAETRDPIPAPPGQPARGEDAYERTGTAHLCMVFEPLAGQRQGKGTERRTAVDVAHLRREVRDEHDPQAEKMVLVMDNLHPHKLASWYEAFAPAAARRLAERCALHYTPKHGSWLNRAETELRVVATQCLDRRMPDPTTLRQEVAAWAQRRHQAQCIVNWRFTTQDARITLKRLYPSIQLG